MQAASTARISVEPLAGKPDRERFLRLPWRLYESDPAWVPNLLFLQRETISPQKNPFFDHGEAELFLAQRGDEVVGRISAQIDRRHVERHGEKAGFFGFLDGVDDPDVVKALLTAAERWLRDRGMDLVRGPMNFSLDEEAGLQVDGFEHPPMIATPFSPSYLGSLVEQAGYDRTVDLLAYRWQIEEPPERMMEAIERTRSVEGLTMRPISMRRLSSEVGTLLDIYNQSWQDNWGFVPVFDRQARKMVSDLRLIADPSIVRIAEVNGEPAGVVVGLPNLYEAINDFKGFIDPWKAFKLFWRLKVRGLETGRIMLFGVKPKFRTRELYGLPFLLLYDLYQAGKKHRYEWCEESWILETNTRMTSLLPYWNAHEYKRYRLYEKALSS